LQIISIRLSFYEIMDEMELPARNLVCWRH
jgi:hypothetical protein